MLAFQGPEEGLGGRGPDQPPAASANVALARSLAKHTGSFSTSPWLRSTKLRGQTQFELMGCRFLTRVDLCDRHPRSERGMTVAHRIAVMDRGSASSGRYAGRNLRQPQSLGGIRRDVNLIEGLVLEVAAALRGGQAGGPGRSRCRQGGAVSIALRPGSHQAGPAPLTPHNAMRGRVCDIGYLGGVSIYKVRLDGGAVVKVAVANVARTSRQTFSTHDEVWLSWPPDVAVVLTD